MVSLWTKVAEFLPNIAGALFLLVIGYLVAKGIGLAIAKLLQKLGLDKLTESSGVGEHALDYGKPLGTLIYMLIVIVVLSLGMGNRQDAEDITQDVMLKLFSRLKSFEGRSSFKTWMVRVTRNACKDWLKKKAISKQYSEALANEPQE